MCVQLEALRSIYACFSELCGARAGKEGTSSYGWIKEADVGPSFSAEEVLHQTARCHEAIAGSQTARADSAQRLDFIASKRACLESDVRVAVLSSCHHLQAEPGQIVDTVLPDPVDSFSGLIAEITAVEITAEEENVLHRIPVHSSQLADFCRLFFSSLVRIREVPCRFCLDHNRQTARLDPAWHDHSIGRNVDRFAIFLQSRHVQWTGECARLHVFQADFSCCIFELTILKPSLDPIQLPPFLSIADDRIGIGSAKTIGYDSCSSIRLLWRRITILRRHVKMSTSTSRVIMAIICWTAFSGVLLHLGRETVISFHRVHQRP